MRLVAGVPELVPMFERFEADVVADGAQARRRGPAVPLTLALRPDAAPGVPVASGVDPGGADAGGARYELRAACDEISIAARAPEGIFRGLTTLRQLIAAPPAHAVGIFDGPRFAWRGLSLDVVRTFFDVTEVKRVIDILSLYKFNVLHLHLTDDQGWRFEIPGYPLLAELGGRSALGGRPGGYYTLTDYADIVEYAAARYVTVVPEIDMPGHSAAALAAYPWLAPGNSTQRTPGTPDNPPTQLHPDTPGVERFVGEVLGTVAAATPGPFLHIGGDEAFGMVPAAYDRFVREAMGVARSLGKTPVCWQDAARCSDGGGELLQHWMAFDPALQDRLAGRDPEGSGDVALPDGLVIPSDILAAIRDHFARGQEDLRGAMTRGAKVILSPAASVYLDRPYAERSIDAGQEELRQRLGFTVYSRATTEQAFAWDPATALDVEAAPSVAGIEAAMWAETVADPAELEFMLLPRLPGVAERAWSPTPGVGWGDYRTRLGAQRGVWSARRWAHFASSLVPWV